MKRTFRDAVSGSVILQSLSYNSLANFYYKVYTTKVPLRLVPGCLPAQSMLWEPSITLDFYGPEEHLLLTFDSWIFRFLIFLSFHWSTKATAKV